jgi:hypothetical protein
MRWQGENGTVIAVAGRMTDPVLLVETQHERRGRVDYDWRATSSEDEDAPARQADVNCGIEHNGAVVGTRGSANDVVDADEWTLKQQPRQLLLGHA